MVDLKCATCQRFGKGEPLTFLQTERRLPGGKAVGRQSPKNGPCVVTAQPQLRSMVSVRTRWMLQATRLVAAFVLTIMVVAIWTVPHVLPPVWVIGTFMVLGLPGAVATFVIKADNERRANGR